MTPRRVLVTLGVVAGCAGCTPHQLEQWRVWWEQDPVAAEAYANTPDVQAQLAAPVVDVRRGDVWDRLAECESGRSWEYNGGSGYDGGLQFLPSTWRAYGGRDFAEHAYQASREQQIIVAERVLADVGWRAWPTCSRRLGLR